MKKYLLVIAVFVALSSCHKHDKLWDSIVDIEHRLTTLEQQCREMNTNIASMQVMVDVMQNNDYVTGVSTIQENGIEVGYKISFNTHPAITIYHGLSPVIGVKQAEDGKYYWTQKLGTAESTWMLDDNGNKITAGSSDAQDGIIPQFKIENDNWMLSVDNGVTWQNLGRAKGDDGKSFFTNITDEEDNLILELENGTSIVLPKKQHFSLRLSNTRISNIRSNSSYRINYTIAGAEDQEIHLEAIGPDGWKISIEKKDSQSGTIIVRTPVSLDGDGKVLVFAVNESGTTCMQSIRLLQGYLSVNEKEYLLESDGGTIIVDVNTNIDYQVNIVSTDQNWIQCQTESGIRNKFTLTISANLQSIPRKSTIELVHTDGFVLERIKISQKASGPIHITTPGTLSTLFTYEELKRYENIKITGRLNAEDYEFLRRSPLKSLDLSDLDDDEIPINAFYSSKIKKVLLPKKLRFISMGAFQNSQITFLQIPETVTEIRGWAFGSCREIQNDIVIPNSVETIGYGAFSQCSGKSLTLGSSLKKIGGQAFWGCKIKGNLVLPPNLEIIDDNAFDACQGFVGNLIIPDKVQEIGDDAFAECNGFVGDLIIPDKVQRIGESAFYNCTGFNGSLIIGKSVTKIENNAFTKLTQYDRESNFLNFSKIYFKPTTPPSISIYSAFRDTNKDHMLPYVAVPVGCKEAYNQKYNFASTKSELYAKIVEEVNL